MKGYECSKCHTPASPASPLRLVRVEEIGTLMKLCDNCRADYEADYEVLMVCHRIKLRALAKRYQK